MARVALDRRPRRPVPPVKLEKARKVAATKEREMYERRGGYVFKRSGPRLGGRE